MSFTLTPVQKNPPPSADKRALAVLFMKGDNIWRGAKGEERVGAAAQQPVAEVSA